METKIVKVTDKGQISIPIGIRNSIGISNGDELFVLRDGETICLKKIKEDDFRDVLKLSEHSMKELWDNKEDKIWDSYLDDS